MVILSKAFFDRPVLQVAPELLGKVLRCGKTVGVITEVEAYDGMDDKACHASKGCTERTKVMFGPAGYWYVYLCYGMYWMLNIVCERENYPAAILIRSVMVRKNTHGDIVHHDAINGPGKVTKYFGIDKKFNGRYATQDSGLWIEDRFMVIAKTSIKRTPRIGVAYAGEWAKKPYRFVISPTLAAGRR